MKSGINAHYWSEMIDEYFEIISAIPVCLYRTGKAGL